MKTENTKINVEIESSILHDAVEVGDVIEVKKTGKKFLVVTVSGGHTGILDLDECLVLIRSIRVDSIMKEYGDVTIHKAYAFDKTLKLTAKQNNS